MKILITIISLSLVFPFIADSSDPIRTAGDIGQIATPL